MIETGERAPDFVLPSRGVPTRFYGIAGGRPVALVFCGPESLDLVSRYAEWVGPDAAVVAVTSGGGDGKWAFPVLVDGEGAVQATGGRSCRLSYVRDSARNEYRVFFMTEESEDSCGNREQRKEPHRNPDRWGRRAWPESGHPRGDGSRVA